MCTGTFCRRFRHISSMLSVLLVFYHHKTMTVSTLTVLNRSDTVFDSKLSEEILQQFSQHWEKLSKSQFQAHWSFRIVKPSGTEIPGRCSRRLSSCSKDKNIWRTQLTFYRAEHWVLNIVKNKNMLDMHGIDAEETEWHSPAIFLP